MMYSWAQSGGSIWLHLHWLFWGLASFGFLVALIWLYKEAKKETLKQVVLWSLIVGIVGGLLTAPVAMRQWTSWMGSHHGWGSGSYGISSDRWQNLSDQDREEYYDQMREHMEWMWGFESDKIQ